jgi:sensor c-di-GMP phosphodiesterase-like protein
MPSSNPRSFHPWIAPLIFALGGMIFGYGAGLWIIFHRADGQLGHQAENVLALADSASGEAITALIKIDSSSYPSCSQEEIASLRSLIFRSRFLKDAGHMFLRDIECSSMLGRLTAPISVDEADFSTPAGTRIFRSLPERATGGVGIFGAQLGNAYVVFSPWIFSDPKITGTHFAVTFRDMDLKRSGIITGERPGLSLTLLTSDGKGRFRGTQYATRCSKRFLTCATAYAPTSQIIVQEHNSETMDFGLGGMFGLAIGILWSVNVRRRQSMEQQLRIAIRKDSIRMVYQPLVELMTGKVVGAEALIRWNDEHGAPVSPDVFIALAEERGLIREITRLVVRHVLDDLAETMSSNPTFQVSINASAADLLDPSFLPILRMEFQDAGVSPASLAIEVTERYMARGPIIAEAVRQLRRAGFSIHLDDFGTGYSSLACLQELEIDAIKIDQLFIQSIGTGSLAQGIIPKILEMADYLKLDVVLEGVETQEQVDYFAAIGKPLVAQGWYFGKPGSADEIRKTLRRDAGPQP